MLILADYTINFTVDYVMYPAVVGAIGLAIGIAVKMLRKLEHKHLLPTIGCFLLVASLSGLGLSLSDMESEAVKIPKVADGPSFRGGSDSDDMRMKLMATHYEYLKTNPDLVTTTEPRKRLLPSWADGTIFGGSLGLLLCSILIGRVYFSKKES